MKAKEKEKLKAQKLSHDYLMASRLVALEYAKFQLCSSNTLHRSLLGGLTGAFLLLLLSRLFLQPGNIKTNPVGLSPVLNDLSVLESLLDCPPCDSYGVAGHSCQTSDKSVLSEAPAMIATADTEALKGVFFGVETWLVVCSDTSKTDLLAVFTEATAILRGSLPLSDRVLVGEMNCSASLPSGKTVYERFRLDSTKPPVAFAVSRGDSPTQIPTHFLGDSLLLGWWLRHRIQPQIWRVRSDSQLITLCLRHKACLLFLTPSAMSLSQKTSILALQANPESRAMHFASLNSSTFSLGIESNLLGKDATGVSAFFFTKLDPDATSEKNDKRVSIGAKAYKGLLTTKALEKFLALVLKDNAKLTTLTKMPSLKVLTGKSIQEYDPSLDHVGALSSLGLDVEHGSGPEKPSKPAASFSDSPPLVKKLPKETGSKKKSKKKSKKSRDKKL